MVISYTTFLPIANPHAVAIDIGIAVNPIPVKLKVKELDVVAKNSNVSNDFYVVVNVLFFISFFDLWFLFSR